MSTDKKSYRYSGSSTNNDDSLHTVDVDGSEDTRVGVGQQQSSGSVELAMIMLKYSNTKQTILVERDNFERNKGTSWSKQTRMFFCKKTVKFNNDIQHLVMMQILPP